MRFGRKLLKAMGVRFSSNPSVLQIMHPSLQEAKRAVGDGTKSSVVMAPLNWLMRSFPEAPLVVERRQDDDWEVDPDHELAALLKRPNPFWSGDMLWTATILSLVTSGNGYWIKLHDSQLRVVQLWWVPSNLIAPGWPQDGSEFITHYEYNPGGGHKVTLNIDDVVHFRWGVDPNNIRLGLSPLESVIREVFSDDEAALFSSAILKNMGVPGLIIAPDGDAVLSDGEPEALEAKLSEKFTGRKRGKPLVASAATKVHQFGFSPQQMDVKMLRRLPEERVSAVLGIPAIVAGLGAGLDRSTFANMAEAREMAYESCVIPLQRMLSSDINVQLLPDFDTDLKKTRTRFAVEESRVLQEDENKKVDRKLNELKAGAITLAQYLRETGRTAEDHHEVYLRPFSVVEVPADPRARPTPGETDGGPGSSSSPALRSRGQKATAVQQAIVQRMKEREQELTGHYTEELIKFFNDLGASCAEGYLELVPAFASRNGGGLKDANDDELIDRIMLRIGTPSLRDANQRQYQRVAEDTVNTVNETLGLGVNLPDETMRGIVERGGTRAGLIDITGSTRTAITRSILEGRELGEGPAAVARRIRDQVPAGRFVNAGPYYRSQLIARTETKYAQNVSAIETYKASPNVRGLLAFDAQGAESDAECIDRDGRVFAFVDADAELAREHPNGTLSFAPVIE